MNIDKQRQIGHDMITINGIEYVKKDSLSFLDGLSLDNIHLIVHRKEVEIRGKICFYCGTTFKGNEVKDNLTKHHAIPKRMKSKYNVFIPLCRGCHKKVNEGTKYRL